MRHGLYPVETPQGKILAQKLYNPACEADDFLSVVLVQRTFDNGVDYVIWIHNHQTDGLSGGDYVATPELAWKRFNERGQM